MSEMEMLNQTRNLLTGKAVNWDDDEPLQPTSGIGDLSLSWKDISVWRQKKIVENRWRSSKYIDVKILHSVSGEAAAGNLIAIMGASGSGKTTLLAAISKRIKNDMDGKVYLNGKEVNWELMSKLTGFVPQKDMVIEELTVNQHMEFMARLMMDKNCQKGERGRRINELLSELNLHNSRNTLLKELSGGEKKRVALAVQLLNDPPILFCDEPTTGLDSWAASAVVHKLRRLASLGKIIICSIHQPASGVFEMFHQVIFLTAGRVAFHGTIEECKTMFDRLDLRCPLDYNSAEYYVSSLAVKRGHEFECNSRIHNICREFQKIRDAKSKLKNDETGIKDSADQHDYFEKYLTIKRVGFLTQFYWLLWRNYLATKRKYSIIVAEFFVYMLVAITCSLPFSNTLSIINQHTIQNLQGLLYSMVTETIFLFIYAVWITFPSEIPVLLREGANGLYSISPYYLSKIILWIPRSVIKPILFSSFVFMWVGLKGGLVVWTWTTFVLILCANLANAYGSLLSACFEKFETATLFSAFLEVVGLIFSGVMISLNSVESPFNLLKYISPFYYGIESIAILQWDQIPNLSCNDSSVSCIQTGAGVLTAYGYSDSNFYRNIIALIALYIIMHVIAYLMVRKKSKKTPVY